MKKLYFNLKENFMYHLNDMSLKRKFILIYVFCVFIPIASSAVLFSVSINRTFYDREMGNLEYLLSDATAHMKNVFNEAVVTSGILAKNDTLIEITSKKFSNETEFYEYFTSKELRDYYNKYVASRINVEDAGIYTYNDTVVEGGLIWKITDSIKKSSWYAQAMMSDDEISVCVSSKLSLAVKKDSISVVRRMYDRKKETIGIIKIDVNMGNVRNYLQSDYEGASMYLVNNSAGQVLNPVDGKFENGFMPPLTLSEQKGYIYFTKDFDDTSYLKNWSMVCRFDKDILVRHQAVNIMWVVLIHAVIMLIILMILSLIYTSMSRRIRALENNISNISQNRFEQLSIQTGNDEIGHMLSVYNSMVQYMNVLINDVYELEVKNKSIEAENIRMELNSLQSQVNPHFIFNVLNAILIAAVKGGNTVIAEQISGLAKMIRRLLDWSEDREPLSTEIDFVELYLKLEKFRFGDQFEYFLDVDEDAEEWEIPKMVIQPLVENACRHGLQGKLGLRRVSVSAKLDDTGLAIRVCDNGCGIPADKLKELTDGLASGEFKGHIGLKNVYRRLKLYLGDRVDMRLESVENEGTEISIYIKREAVDDEN